MGWVSYFLWTYHFSCSNLYCFATVFAGDIFHAAPNIDHSQEFVRRDIKEWLNWLRNDIGFDGWRLDFVR